MSFPNLNDCAAKNWDLGDQPDPNAPPKPWPVVGQQVYIQDATNFCINLPDPDSPVLKEQFYSKGKYPTIVAAEGYVRAFCMGDHLTPGALRIPPGGITAAHVVKRFKQSGDFYWQITGRMNCDILKINCTPSTPTAYDDGGQYDSVPYRYCGKEPYSGVDASKHPGFPNYVEQAGDGIFCMRVCQGGLGDLSSRRTGTSVHDRPDPNAPPKPWPIADQYVYIKDQ